MRRASVLVAALLVAAVVPGGRADATIGDPIDNVEQRVNGRADRTGAQQSNPDVSSSHIVWWDQRGNTTNGTGNAIWSKDLNTRGEAPVTTLTTSTAIPRISGRWVVWADRKPGSVNDDIFARKLPSGDIIRVTKNAATQLNPAIDGKTVVWADKRSGDIDIYKKVLSTKKRKKPKEKPVVVAPGDQTAPSISGQTVAWRDGRRGLTAADVYVRVGSDPEIEIARATGAARSISSHQVAVAGSRLLWNEVDPIKCGLDCEPKILKTCTLPCTSETVVDELAPLDPDGSAITELDADGVQATYVKRIGDDHHAYRVDLSTCDVPPCAAPTMVDGGSPLTISEVRVSGPRFAWTSESDIYWRDIVTGEGPLRANSLGWGEFEGAANPAADGDLVAYQSRGGIWATDLSPRRHFAVASDLATAFSSPAIEGTRVTWSDNTACLPSCPVDQDVDDTYERDPAETGTITQLSSPDETGGAPDVDGSATAWRCKDGGGDPVALCVDDGSLTAHDVSAFLLDPASVIGDRVRISGDLLGWYEFFEGGPDAALHVFDMSIATDTVVGSGIDVVGEFPDFDLDGSNIVWAGSENPEESAIWRNTVTGTPGTATVFEAPVNRHVLRQVTIDGTQVAWIDCPSLIELTNCDVVTRELSESESHVVTEQSSAIASAPFIDGDRIYWHDFRNGSIDVFVESLSGAALPPTDTVPPGPPTAFTAIYSSGDVDLAWTNPTDSDFFGVRILRKPGKEPPKSLGDTRATLVYDDDGTSFTDEDVVQGVYSYRIFAFDQEGNVSASATARAG